MDLLRLSTRGRELLVPEVSQFGEPAHTSGALFVGAGMGDNAAAAEGVGIEAGDTLVSLGTSGVVTAITADRPMDESGVVAGFAAARPGLFLPLACTLNGAELFDSYARLLGVSLDELAELALSAEPKSAGVVTVPYFNGERTPNLPNARGSLTGLSLANFTAENLARSLVEGLLQGLAFAMDSVSASSAGKVYMVGGAAKSRAVREIAPVIFGRPVVFPDPAEYVALGAAKQASELVREQNS
jgi:xylulokinase